MNYVSTHKLKSFLILIFCFVVFVALSQSQEKQVVFVPYTGDTDSFVSKLAEEGLIQNKFSEMLLRVVLAIKGDIQPGGYEFSKGMGAVSTALAIDEPQYEYILIFDGFRKGQIGEIIGEKLGWSEEKITSFGETEPICLLEGGDEGFLASGTYLIHKREDIEVVQETMQKTFDEILDDLGIDEDDVNIPEIITIASLIQREAAGKSDMRLISGIIHNRLETGMSLQIDATLQYVRGREGNWWPVPRPEDKKIDSLFNTYMYGGLPPAPIATPSKDAIRAALNPMRTDCIFYLHDKRGNIHCSTNYEKHKQNIQYYLK
jgi:UPF0755 protein